MTLTVYDTGLLFISDKVGRKQRPGDNLWE